MPIDLSKLERSPVSDSATEPRRIFNALPSKDDKYSYPRDVQSEVWNRWHDRRAQRDLVIKMNTGGGKTVVGLIALKSCLNEKVGPAVYVTPDKYLARQVEREAKGLGLQVTDDPDSSAFLQGRAILIVNIHKLFNGKSKFGVSGSSFRSTIELGAVLIDDAHACMATVNEQFTLEIPHTHKAYNKLVELFAGDLREQSLPGFKDLEQGDRSALMGVPAWAWTDKQAAVLDILHPHRDDEELMWRWPLVVESLPLCRVAITPQVIEIAPPCPPVEMLPSFTRAKRRLYLTATLADDSILVTQFDAAPDLIRKPVTPDRADDLGDRMILTPQETFPDVDEDAIRTFLAARAAKDNVVVIVPSGERAKAWAPYAAATATAKDLEPVLDRLRNEHVGLVVLINKYDGIDLPDKACRILVLDGLPEARDPLERLESDALGGSDVTLARQVQRIEQGMGRGVRSNKDFCVVMLLGTRLITRLNSPQGRALLSPATRAQLELSDRLAALLEGQDFSSVSALIDQCLGRDPAWVAPSRDALDDLPYADEVEITEVAIAARGAFDLAGRGRHVEGPQRLKAAFDAAPDSTYRGLMKAQAAAYLHPVDPVGAQALQLSAIQDNRSVARPVDGVTYKPLRPIQEQGKSASTYLTQRYPDAARLVLGVRQMLSDLIPAPDAAMVGPFEKAVAELGRHLGFSAQRPEQEIGNGPDDLWSIGDNKYFVIECKSAATATSIARKDIEQLGQSLDWFASRYDETAKPTGILIHPTSQLHTKATARTGARVMTFKQLEGLCEAVQAFARSIAVDDQYKDPVAVTERLANAKLNAAMFAGHWTRAPKSARR